MKFEDFLRAIEKVPSHTGYSIDGLEYAKSYLQQLVSKIEESLLLNQIDFDQSKELNILLNNNIFALNDRIKKINKYDKAEHLMKQLGIEVFDHYIRVNDIYDILIDEIKLNNLIKMLKCKAFW